MKKGKLGNILMFILFALVIIFLLLLSKNKGSISEVLKDISGLFS
ncbi:MAG TPA: hypothetical protein VJI46_06325 [Candidatus Nanoarchaeia archaeon]|nr:hypothetical protein [Candidatus Nanoarchaeia archaeon]